MDDFHVVARDTGVRAKSLSGGNLQKFILGPRNYAGPKLLILAILLGGLMRVLQREFIKRC